MSDVHVSWIKAITCSCCITHSLMDLPFGSQTFPCLFTSQIGKAKPTLPGEIVADTRYANIIYLVCKWQSWSVFANEKNREKPKGRKVIKEIVCWFPRSSLSFWRSWDCSNMTWALGYWVSMPTVLFIISISSEHGISERVFFFSEGDFRGEDAAKFFLVFSSLGL